METLEKLSNEFANIQQIEKELFDVVQIPLKTGDERFFSPDVFGNYKAHGGDCLGVVGNRYTPQQPKFLFDALTHCFIDAGLNLSKVKYNELKGGAKILFTVPLKSVSFVNLRGKQDQTDLTLNVMTGYDGLTQTKLFISAYRLICSNGMKASVTEFTSKFKNTIGNTGKVGALCDDVLKAADKSNELQDLLVKLNSIEITEKTRMDFLAKVLKFKPNELDALSTKKRNILDRINESIELEISRSGGNLWALFNGVTHYTNHVVKDFDTETDKLEYLYTATGATLNDTAFETVLEFAN